MPCAVPCRPPGGGSPDHAQGRLGLAGGGGETLLLLSPLDWGRLEPDIIVTISKDKLLESYVAVKYKSLFN